MAARHTGPDGGRPRRLRPATPRGGAGGRPRAAGVRRPVDVGPAQGQPLDSPVVQQPVRHLGGHRLAALGGRHLCGHGVLGHAADAGDRHPHGSRRPARTGHLGRHAPRTRAGRRGAASRGGRRVRGRPPGREPAGADISPRPRDAGGGAGGAGGGDGGRVRRPGAPGGRHRSGRCAPVRRKPAAPRRRRIRQSIRQSGTKDRADARTNARQQS